jgi:thiamine biosynthesis lipoprotein
VLPKLAGLLILLVGCGGPVSKPGIQVLQGTAFGTTWQVKWFGTLDPKVESSLLSALDVVDRGMSTWRDDSELMQVRRGAGPVSVSPETYRVVKAALGLASTTEGAFDPTVQPLMELWGFHGEPRATWPSDEELAAVKEKVGYEKVRVLRNGDGSGLLDAGGTALDLSAIAKGHSVDRLSEVLSEYGYNRHLLEVGGELRAKGEGPRGSGWVVGVDKPILGSAPGVDFAAIFELKDVAMATSGNYRNRVTVGERQVGHTLDPRTGLPVESSLRSVTVITDNCMMADGFATALMVLGVEEGLKLVERIPGVDALLLVEGDAGMEERVSSELSRHRKMR